MCWCRWGRWEGWWLMNDPILIIEWALALIILFAAVFIAIGNDRDGRGA